MPNTSKNIQSFQLNEAYFHIHKTATFDSGFGMDHTTHLIENSFGVYSGVHLQTEVGPLKSNFYRIALCLGGSLHVEIGAETFQHRKNSIHFNVPDRLFLMKNKSEDLECQYLFFTAEFLEELISEEKLKALFPFFNYLNAPFFELSETEMEQIKNIFWAISKEIHAGLSDHRLQIKLLVITLLIQAKRSYIRQELTINQSTDKTSQLVSRYKKMVAQYFITIRNVKDYAEKLSITSNHLQKIIKQETGKSAGEFIDDMLLMEIKALLRYTQLNISEIAHQLEFTDASHLAKFFKKYTGLSPVAYRKKHN
jgi:hypothetical protein